MREADGYDLEVLGASLRQGLAQIAEDACRLLVEGKDRERHQQFEAVLEFRVAVNLLRGAGLLPADEGAPALGHLLGGDDGGEDLGLPRLESRLQSPAERGVMHEFSKVIRVENDEHRLTISPG